MSYKKTFASNTFKSKTFASGNWGGAGGVGSGSIDDMIFYQSNASSGLTRIHDKDFRPVKAGDIPSGIDRLNVFFRSNNR